MKLRKKLTMTIIGLVVNWIGVWLAQKGIDLTPDQELVLYQFGTAMSGLIIMVFNIGQGIADKGKEAGKQLLVLFLCGALMMVPMAAWAQPVEGDDCVGNYNACIELLDECTGADCPVCEVYEACQDCGWVSLIKDKTFMAAVIGGAVLLIGGIAGIFIPPPS